MSKLEDAKTYVETLEEELEARVVHRKRLYTQLKLVQAAANRNSTRIVDLQLLILDARKTLAAAQKGTKRGRTICIRR